MFPKSSFLCSENLGFQWVQPQPKPRRQTSKMSLKFACTSAPLQTHSLLCDSAQRPCWGKNVTRTGGMTVGNKRGPPVSGQWPFMNWVAQPFTGSRFILPFSQPASLSTLLCPLAVANLPSQLFSLWSLKSASADPFHIVSYNKINVSARPTRCRDNAALRDLLQFLSFVFIYFLQNQLNQHSVTTQQLTAMKGLICHLLYFPIPPKSLT